MNVLNPSPKTRGRNFGYLPTGAATRDVYTWLFGVRNPLKRLQGRDILNALALDGSERVLDLGCGTGYLTVEIAKGARHAIGVDVDPRILSNKIPRALANRLSFTLTSGDGLPFPAESFDVVLASEVLPMLPDPSVFLEEVRRVVRPGGRVVVVNGAGHPVIREAYERRSPVLRLAQRLATNVPRDYEEYCAVLQREFGTAQRGFLDEREVTRLLEDSGLVVAEVVHSPGYVAGATLSWLQFFAVARARSPLTNRLFVPKLAILRILDRLSRRRYEGGLITVASVPYLAP